MHFTCRSFYVYSDVIHFALKFSFCNNFFRTKFYYRKLFCPKFLYVVRNGPNVPRNRILSGNMNGEIAAAVCGCNAHVLPCSIFRLRLN